MSTDWPFRAHAPRAKTIDRPRPRHRQQPAGDRASAAIVARGLLPGLDEDVLHDVLRFGLVLQDAEDQRIDEAGMAIVELGRGRRISGRQPVEQTSITGIGSRSIDTRPRQRGQQPHPMKLTSGMGIWIGVTH